MCDCSLALVRWKVGVFVRWKIAFLYQVALYEPKNRLYRESKFFHQQKTLRTSLKATFLRTKTSFAHAFFRCPQKFPIFTNQKFFFRTNLSLFPPKAILFHPPPPIPTTLNLLSAKNTAILLLSALIPCAVKPERRTDSNHCRRYPEKCSFQHSQLPDECRSFQKKSRIDRRFESSPESRGSQTSGVLFGSFCTTQKE